MRLILQMALMAAALAVAAGSAGCAEPPNKEMHEAQGAIDAARAAGADRYAAEEYKAAVDALQRSRDAAAQRDYRLALNNALDSRERAQIAAREAASQRAQSRSQAERMLADLATALSAATARLDTISGTRLPPKALASAREAIAAGQHALQEAGTVLGREDYPQAQKVIGGHAASVRAATQQIDAILAANATKPPRRAR
jgi:flagellar hook-basal body complex protein FliE